MCARLAEQASNAGGSSGRPVVREIRDTAEIVRYLELDRPYTAAAFAYLENGARSHTRWLAVDADEPAMCVFGAGPSGGLVLTLGSQTGIAAILDAERGPLQAYVVCRPEHLAVVSQRYALWERQDLLRMVVTRETFRAVERPGVLRLRPSDVEALNRLYRSESGASFAPYHLSQGVYFGVWEDGLLVSVAGTQMTSWTFGTAIVANVLTHPRYRGRGYATAVTSAVTAELLERCREVVLNVDPTNDPAVRAYTRLGYRDGGRLSEAWGLRKQGGFWSTLVRWVGQLFGR